MLDTGQLQVFDSGKAAVNAQGKEALAQVSGVLSSLPARRFQVAGQTDNQPIRRSGFGSNWELSAERALQVTQYLIQSGMAADTLSAAAYGEFDALVANDTAENRAKNPRIEITLQPNIDEFVALPESG